MAGTTGAAIPATGRAATSLRVLLLGGTSEARALAAKLVHDGVNVTSSLAGRVARPRMPVGSVRIGGFGGIEGLRRALTDFDAVIDATHPFATVISAAAHQACEQVNVPRLILRRPPWRRHPLRKRQYLPKYQRCHRPIEHHRASDFLLLTSRGLAFKRAERARLSPQYTRRGGSDEPY